MATKVERKIVRANKKHHAKRSELYVAAGTLFERWSLRWPSTPYAQQHAPSPFPTQQLPIRDADLSSLVYLCVSLFFFFTYLLRLILIL